MSFSQNTPEDEFGEVILTGKLIQNPWNVCKKLVIYAPNEKVWFCLIPISAQEAVTTAPTVLSVLTRRSINPSLK